MSVIVTLFKSYIQYSIIPSRVPAIRVIQIVKAFNCSINDVEPGSPSRHHCGALRHGMIGTATCMSVTIYRKRLLVLFGLQFGEIHDLVNHDLNGPLS